VRQWVLTFPFPLRFLLAAQPGVLTEVLAIWSVGGLLQTLAPPGQGD
jgi:hypothetical protein